MCLNTMNVATTRFQNIANGKFYQVINFFNKRLHLEFTIHFYVHFLMFYGEKGALHGRWQTFTVTLESYGEF